MAGPQSIPYNALGYATVGTGNESTGEFNLPNFQTWGKCVERALSGSAGVVLLKGVHNALGDSFVNVQGSGKEVIIAAGADVRNAKTGAVGAFKLNDARQRIICDKAKFTIDSWVNSQILFSMVGRSCEIVNPTITMTTTAGNTATPYEAAVADTVVDPIFRGFRVFPNKGMRVFRLQGCDGGLIDDAIVRNDGNDALGSAATPRSCYEVGRMVLCQNSKISNAFAFGLGTLTTDELAAVWVLIGNGTGTNLSGNVIERIKVDQVVSPTFLRLNGLISFDIADVFLGNSRGRIATAGDAGILIDSTDGSAQTPPTETGISGAGRITGLHCESTASGDGVLVYFKNAKKIKMSDVQAHLPTGGPKYFFNMDIPTARALKFSDMLLDGTAGTTLSAFKFTGTAPFAPIGITIGRDIYTSGCLYGVAPGGEPGVGFGAGYSYDDGSIGIAPNLSSGGSQVVTNNTGVDPAILVGAGGLVSTIPAISTFTGVASGSGNFAAAVFANSLTQLGAGLGRFQYDVTDNGGGAAADGTIAAVTNVATFADAMKELTTKRNELVDAPKTIAGRIKLLKTWVLGAGASTAAVTAATPLSYTSTATLSAAAADQSINDSASGIPAFVANDIVSSAGFTGVATTANQVGIVVSRTISKLVVKFPVAIVDDAATAGETVTLRKLNADPTASGVIAKLVDNSGGTPDVTGAIPPITNAATAANAIATFSLILNAMIDYLALQSNYGISSLQGT